MNPEKVRLSIVIPVCDEQRNIRPLYERLMTCLTTISADGEIIFVDDGSADSTAAEVLALREKDPKVKLVSFSRNFGHQAALSAGMDRATGDAVVSMDGDLQHPPELIAELVKRWREGYEVVYTIRTSNKDAFGPKAVFSALYYWCFRRVSGVDLPSNAADFRLLDAKVVAVLKRMPERNRFLRGMVCWTGYKSVGVPYEAGERKDGSTKYSFARMAGLALDGLVSFSVTPLYFAVGIGATISLLGFIYTGYGLYSKLVTHQVLPGWTSLMMLTAIVGGFQLLVLGIIGVYLGKVYEEIKQRPLYVVSREAGFTHAS